MGTGTDIFFTGVSADKVPENNLPQSWYVKHSLSYKKTKNQKETEKD